MTAYDDFRFASTSDLADLGGPASRFNHNITAIKLLKSFEAEGRALNAYYTALPTIGAIYEALDHLGIGVLDSLRVLEPAAGIGHFFGAMPAEIAAKAERMAIELDSITARILRYLYPNAKVFNQGFEEAVLPNGYFDLILGNPPYGNYAVHDPLIKQRHLKAAIHDYFFARSIRLVKPGGIIAFITSRYTLDKAPSRVRRHIAEHAELLATARLPESAFRKNAGTEVVTDVLILRKKYKPGGVDEKLSWIETDVFPNQMDYRVPVNRLYIESTDLMLSNCWKVRGTFSMSECCRSGLKLKGLWHFQKCPELSNSYLGVPECSRGMYSDCEVTLKPDGRDLARALRDSLISQLPSQAITATASQLALLAPSLMEGAQEKEKAGAVNLDRLSGTSRQRASLLLDICSAAKQVIRLQLLDARDEALTRAQRELNDLYLRFTARYGPINANQNLKDFDRRSPIVPFLKALEEPTGKGSWKRAAIFHSRTIRPHKDFSQISSPKDVLFFCLNECGRVDLDRIAALTGRTRNEVADALRGLINETTSGGWVTADEYLSGYVVQKLKDARAAATLDPRFQANVEALKAVQPATLGPEEIAARLGAGWIPAEVVRDFIREIVPQFDGRVEYVEHLGVWKIEGAKFWARNSIEAAQTWGTARMDAIDLVEDALNLRQPAIYDEIDEPAGKRRVLNDTETVAAQAKLAEIKLKFVSWLWSSEPRARELCAIYNERYNCLRERRYDGGYLQLPGMNSSITLRPHQLDGVQRVLQNKATLLGHAVGAGKAQPITAKILTPRGWKTMGEIRIGDEVIAGDGTVTKVIGVYPQGVKSIYRVTFSDGSSTECCKEHLWKTQTYKERENFRRVKDKERFAGKARTLEEIKDSLLARLGIKNHSIPLVGAVAFTPQPIPLDPYLLGVIIGDGCCSTGVTITTGDQEVIEECRKGMPSLTEIKRISSSKYEYSVNRILRRGLGRHNPVRDALRDLGLYGKLSYDKFVPDIYKFNTPEIRLSVLRGLMDADGTVEKRGKGVCFSTASERLAKDVISLVQSLGGTATHTTKRTRHRRNGVVKEGALCHNVWVSMPSQINPFLLSRKASRVKPKTKYPPTRFITGVDYVGENEARCITVSHPDQLYVTDDFIVTHNTFLMVAAAMELKRLGLCHKSMVVVPNHLVAQWEAEARKLYPSINLLAPTKEELSASQRCELMSRISTGDWDLIVTPHSSFKLLPVSPETIGRYIQREIDTLREYLEGIPNDERGERRKTIKEIERAIKKLEVKLKDCESAIQRDSKHTITWALRLRRVYSIRGIAMELVKFDLQLMENPEIKGVEYQQGELAGYELKEYLSLKFGHQCAYRRDESPCEEYLEVEHIIPRSRGGSNRVSNLTIACRKHNLEKGDATATEYGFPEVQAQAKRPLKDAAAVNTTRWALLNRLRGVGLPVETGSGGLTKFNRTQRGLPKAHWIDAACVGHSTPEKLDTTKIKPLRVKAVGHNSRQMCRMDKYGFPRTSAKASRTVKGFRTGDLVKAVVPKGKKQGVHVGKVAVRSSGSFNIVTAQGTIQGISYRHCQSLHRADGYSITG